MMRKCLGCGVGLQSTDPQAAGYTPKADADYCQRCFRLKNYGQLAFSAKHEVNSMPIFEQIAALDVLVLWVVDLFDLETGLRETINRWLADHDIIMVCTKRDLLPESVGAAKLTGYLQKRLRDNDIKVKGIVVVGEYGQDGKTEVLKAIDLFRKGRDVAVIGNTNAGKSSLLRTVFGLDSLTVSAYPGTTLELMGFKLAAYTLYDTPGYNRLDNAQILLDDRFIKAAVPQRRIKPQVYQLNGDQSLAVGGLVRIDLIGCGAVSCVGYFADGLRVHRGKAADADRLWQDHYAELLAPVIGDQQAFKRRRLEPQGHRYDLVILGLGWFCIDGSVDALWVSANEHLEILCRKAMI